MSDVKNTFVALVNSAEWLENMIDNVEVSNDGDIFYTFDGIMDCVVYVQNGLYGDVADVNRTEVQNSRCCVMPTVRHWFDSLEDLVAQLNKEVNPSRM